MLLNKSAYYFEKLANRGLVTEREASEFIGEVEEDIFNLLDCREATHKDQLSLRAKKMRISSIPTYMMTGVSNTAPPCESDSFAERGRKVYPISIDVGSPV